jgi:protein TonB
MNTTDLDYSDDDAPEGSFLKRNWLALTVGIAVLAGGTSAAIALSSKGGAGTRKADNMMMVTITPPPPVVLPPPPPPPPQDEEMIKAEEEKEEEAPQEDNSPSTGNVTNGPADNFGLKAGKGRGAKPVVRIENPVSVWTKYANGAASRIADAMRRHNRLKHSNMSVTAQVWIDGTGRITRAEVGSTGEASLDAALRNDILNGMQLSSPPPANMKMPVNLKLNARRPG